MYNTAKSILPGYTYTENLSQKILLSALITHFGFNRDEIFSSRTLHAFLINSRRKNTAIYFLCKLVELKTRFCLMNFFGATSRKPHKLNTQKSIFLHPFKLENFFYLSMDIQEANILTDFGGPPQISSLSGLS